MLIIVCGLPGSGKTTLARALARKYSAVHLSSDIVRKKIVAAPTYSAEEKRRVYDEFAAHAERLLAKGKDVVADATFYRREQRMRMVRLATAAGTRSYIVLCVLPDRETEERLAGKGPRGKSDADYGVYTRMKRQFEPVSGSHVHVDTTLPLKEQVRLVAASLEEH